MDAKAVNEILRKYREKTLNSAEAGFLLILEGCSGEEVIMLLEREDGQRKDSSKNPDSSDS